MVNFEAFHSKVDRLAKINVAWCWLHTYYDEHGNKNKPRLDWTPIKDPFMGFDNLKLYVIREVECAKVEGERLREKLFEQWVIKHSND